MKLFPSMGALKGFEGGNSDIYSSSCLDEPEENGGHGDCRNLEVIVDAVKVLLEGLEEDVNREGLKKTPLRVAKAFMDGTRGYRQNIKDIIGSALFPEAGIENGAGCGGGSGGLVVIRNIDLFSYCEACLLPFKVRLHVAYVSSDQRVVGLSKLSRAAEVFAKRLQSPQRLVGEICKALNESIRPLGVALILECWHIQFPGIEGNADELKPNIEEMQGWIPSSVYAGSGLFENESCDMWNEFIELLHLGGVKVVRPNSNISCVDEGIWCPFPTVSDHVSPTINGRTFCRYKSNCNGNGPNAFSKNLANSSLQAKLGTSYSMMIAAVESILSGIGENPWRDELRWTPFRFVWWLSNFYQVKPAIQLRGFEWKRVELESNGCSGKTDAKVSTIDVGSEIIFEVNVPFCSQCEHHLLPFSGVAHIGYFSIKEKTQVDRSKIVHIVQFFSHRLQVQERLTRQIAETISACCNAANVIVVLEANHICMLSRGIEKIGSSTATVAALGCFITDSSLKSEFLQKISQRGLRSL